MKIILISGVIGSGKDFFVEKYRLSRPGEKIMHLKFASGLVKIASETFGVDLSDSHNYDKWKLTGKNRTFLINLGCALKRHVDIAIFPKMVINEIKAGMEDGYDTFVISDFRFPVEYFTIKNFVEGTSGDRRALEVYTTDFKSYRYEIRHEQSSERMAIMLRSRGAYDGMNWDLDKLEDIMFEYINENGWENCNI